MLCSGQHAARSAVILCGDRTSTGRWQARQDRSQAQKHQQDNAHRRRNGRREGRHQKHTDDRDGGTHVYGTQPANGFLTIPHSAILKRCPDFPERWQGQRPQRGRGRGTPVVSSRNQVDRPNHHNSPTRARGTNAVTASRRPRRGEPWPGEEPQPRRIHGAVAGRPDALPADEIHCHLHAYQHQRDGDRQCEKTLQGLHHTAYRLLRPRASVLRRSLREREERNIDQHKGQPKMTKGPLGSTGRQPTPEVGLITLYATISRNKLGVVSPSEEPRVYVSGHPYTPGGAVEGSQAGSRTRRVRVTRSSPCGPRSHNRSRPPPARRQAPVYSPDVDAGCHVADTRKRSNRLT